MLSFVTLKRFFFFLVNYDFSVLILHKTGLNTIPSYAQDCKTHTNISQREKLIHIVEQNQYHGYFCVIRYRKKSNLCNVSFSFLIAQNVKSSSTASYLCCVVALGDTAQDLFSSHNHYSYRLYTFYRLSSFFFVSTKCQLEKLICTAPPQPSPPTSQCNFLEIKQRSCINTEL